MRDDDREFERIVRDGWGGSASSLPGADRFRPWAACPLFLALAAGAALYPLVWEGFARALAFLLTGEPGGVDGSAPGWAGTLVRPPLHAREELAAVFCAVAGAKLAVFVGDFVPAGTIACRGYAAGLRLTKLVAWFVGLGAVAAIVVGAA